MTERATSQQGVGGPAKAQGADAQVFAAEIRPHRSLTTRGFVTVMIGFSALATMISVPFFLMGAWPVVGFLGLDVLALWLAFRISFRQARACEQVALTYVELLIRKVSARGAAREWRFNPSWVRLETESDEDFGMTGIAVASRGRRIAVAEALSPHERADFAEAFGRALATVKAGMRR